MDEKITIGWFEPGDGSIVITEGEDRAYIQQVSDEQTAIVFNPWGPELGLIHDDDHRLRMAEQLLTGQEP